MSVIRSERNEAHSSYVFKCIELYEYAQLHLRNLEKKYNPEKTSIMQACDKLIELSIFAYKYSPSTPHEYQLRKDCLVEMACWLEKIDVMLTIIKNSNGIENRILVPFEILLDKEMELVKKEKKKGESIFNDF